MIDIKTQITFGISLQPRYGTEQYLDAVAYENKTITIPDSTDTYFTNNDLRIIALK